MATKLEGGGGRATKKYNFFAASLTTEIFLGSFQGAFTPYE